MSVAQLFGTDGVRGLERVPEVSEGGRVKSCIGESDRSLEAEAVSLRVEDSSGMGDRLCEVSGSGGGGGVRRWSACWACLLYTSDAADDM
eukprot:12959510-Alexandrium_andersonii.AAC.1